MTVRFMRKLLLSVFLVLPAVISGTVWKASDIDVVYLRDSLRHVCDPEDLLRSSAVDTMDLMLSEIESLRGVQSIVVVVSQVEGGDTYEFGMSLARLHGVGSKTQNSGLIVVLSTEDRAYSILTGTGLEGTLPDAICGRIERNYMVPYFKQGDWSSGMKAGVQAICAYVKEDPTLLPSQVSEGGSGGLGILLVLLAVIAIFVLSIYASHRTTHRCPYCPKGQMREASKTLLYTLGGYDYYRVVMRCDKCGYRQTSTRKQRHDDNNHNLFRGILFGTLLGSMFRGGGRGGMGGGGFGGGSFGGGSFGGGGASGKF